MRALILAATILGGVVPLSGLRAQQSELIFDITVARHSLVSTDGNAAAHLSAATSSFKGFNASSCVVADFPCCVTLRKSGSTQTWSNPDENIVNSPDEANTILNRTVAQVKVVFDILACDDFGQAVDGCSYEGGQPRSGIIVESVSRSDVWAHEFGHMSGMDDNMGTGCDRDLMKNPGVPGSPRDVVTPGLCDMLKTPIPPYTVGSGCSFATASATYSYYVPMAGASSEGLAAYQYFRACPNNDGGTSLPNNARIKVVLRDASDQAIVGADVSLVLNGGTPAQGFVGQGADSIIANSQFNQNPWCPDVRTISADYPTDGNGVTTITFCGSLGTRDPNRKWGHYDSEIPVYAGNVKIDGRLTSASSNGTYVLRIKNYDHVGGLGTALNQGEVVAPNDFNDLANNIGVNDLHSYWRDFDSNGSVSTSDYNQMSQHVTHDCNTPNPF